MIKAFAAKLGDTISVRYIEDRDLVCEDLYESTFLFYAGRLDSSRRLGMETRLTEYVCGGPVDMKRKVEYDFGDGMIFSPIVDLPDIDVETQGWCARCTKIIAERHRNPF